MDCTKCYAKCTDKISEEKRLDIFEKFWSLTDEGKSSYYAKFTQKMEKERNRSKSEKSRRDFSYLFFFELDGVKMRVCKTFFLKTLGISQSRVKYFYSNLTDSTTGTPLERKQGKHVKLATAPSEIDFVKRHILLYPVVDSHYCREKTKRQYLESMLNISIMYDQYKEFCSEKGLQPVKMHKYRQIFNEEFNLGFTKPKSDRCDACEESKMNVQKGKVLSEGERESIEHHKFLARDAYEERERDRKSDAAVLCFDLENVLTLPRANVSNFFYKRKLSVYNLTVHCSIDKTVFCAVWNEVEGGRGGNAIASALLKVLDQFVQMHPTVPEIILWSDSCVPQNRNSLMAYALLSFIKKHPHVTKITQKYSEAGHSMIQEVDSAHSSIEATLEMWRCTAPLVS